MPQQKLFAPERENGNRSRAVIDSALRFVPEQLTPLYYTEIYSRSLAERHRIRYNQLFALYLNELAVLFETRLTRAYASLLSQSFISVSLKEQIRQYLADEDRHWRMFNNLNRQAAPELYEHRIFCFVQLSRAASLGINFFNHFSSVLPLNLILIYMGEERTLYYVDCFEKNSEQLDSRFESVHKIHLEDEVRHLDLDQQVLTLVWERLSPQLRRVNAKLVQYCLREFFTLPKRSGIKIVERLMLEFPELEPMRVELINEMFESARSSSFSRTLFDNSVIPNTIAFFARYQEFRILGEVIPGLRNQSSH